MDFWSQCEEAWTLLGCSHAVYTDLCPHPSLQAFSVLGYAVETTSARPGAAEEPVQATPKRLVGVLKKEFVIGVAASRYHCAVFTADSLFTWGKNVSLQSLWSVSNSH